MRVLLITPYKPARDGLRYYSEYLVEAMHSVDPELAVRTFAWNYPNKLSRFLGPMRRLPNLYSEYKRADVVHVQYVAPLYLFYPFFFFIFSKMRGIKTVLTLHELTKDVSWSFIWKTFQETFVRLSDKVIVHTEYQRDLMGKGVRGRVVVIAHGIPSSPHPAYEEVEGNVLLVGFIAPWKGYDLAIRALHSLQGDLPNIGLTIVGKPHNKKYANELDSLVEELGLGERVMFEKDFVSREKFEMYLKKANVVLLPYLRIAMSGILTEAISWGKLIVMSDLKPFIEYTHGKGVYFEKGDFEDLAEKISLLLRDSALQKNQKNLVSSLSEEYSYENTAKKTLRVYQQLIHES